MSRALRLGAYIYTNTSQTDHKAITAYRASSKTSLKERTGRHDTGAPVFSFSSTSYSFPSGAAAVHSLCLQHGCFIYWRPDLCRVPSGLPSVVFRELGKDAFAERFFLTLGKEPLCRVFFFTLGKENFKAHFEAVN